MFKATMNQEQLLYLDYILSIANINRGNSVKVSYIVPYKEQVK